MLPNHQIAALAYTSGFIQKPEAQKYMVGYLQAVRAYLDAFTKGKNKDQVVQVLAKETKIDDTKLWSEMVPAGLDPNGKLNVKSIHDTEDFFKKLNLTPADAPPPSAFIDESFATKAAQTLGPYS